jgi:hypothetical protein
MVIASAMVAASFGLPAAPGNAGSQPHPRCGPSNARTIASSEYARAFVRRGIVYVCGKRRGERTVRLGGERTECESSTGCGGIDLVRLTGRWVGYESFLAPNGSSASSTIEVRSFRSGRILHQIRIGGSSKDGDALASSFGLVLKRNGSAAWISSVRRQPRTDPPSSTREVHRFDRTGHAVLDTAIVGSDADITALDLEGSILSWIKMGERKSVILH